jgi:DNA polymerase III subunit beta
MDFTVKSDDLANELGLLGKIVANKPTIAIVANVLVVTGDESLTLTATDLELSLRCKCPAVITKPGTATLPARKLYELVRSMPGADIRLRLLDTGAIKLTGGEFDSRLQSMTAEDFPKIPEAASDSIEIDRAAFKRLVTQTRFAMTEGDQRYMLNGAQFTIDVEAGVLRMVSTDGHRLAVSTAKTDIKDYVGDSVIIPAKALDEITALLSEDGEANVLMSVDDKKLFLNIDGRVMSSMLMEAQYPAWQKILPKASGVESTVNRAALQTSLRRVLMLSTERIKGVDISGDKTSITLSTKSAEYGEGSDKIAAKLKGKGALKTRCNGQYVLDFLEAATGESVTVDAKDDQNAILFTDGGDYTYVVMPIRA